MKKLLFTLLKILISAAIIGWLFVDAVKTQDGVNVFRTMLDAPKQWDLLAAAVVSTAAAIVLTLIRWCFLVRALGITFSIRDALRIGFLGYLFNLSPAGIAGGDLLKAVMLAREHPGNRAKSAASVIIDRVVGLYVLFVVASAGILLTGFYWRVPEVRLVWRVNLMMVCQGTLLLTVVGTVGIAIVLGTGILDGRWLQSLTRLRRIGPALGSLIDALRMYRRDRAVLLTSALMTVGVHCLLVMGMYLIARGLPGKLLPLSEQFVVYPISSVFSTIPLPAGPFETVYCSLYIHADPGLAIPKGQALIIALVFRLVNVLLAAVGFVYYLGARREVAEVMHEVEEESHAPPGPTS